MKKTKLFIDTDIGDDIDDLLALMMVCNMEEAELVGITTVFRNSNLRARMVKKVLSLCGMEVPVYAGYGIPLGSEFLVSDTDIFCQASPDLNEEQYSPVNDKEGSAGESALDFIVECAERYGRELTLVAIGPLTNLAKAFLKAPDSLRKLNKIVVMGGAFYVQCREWNIICDLKAADIVINSGLPLEFVGIDVTEKTELDGAYKRRILEHRNNIREEYIARCSEIWTRNREIVLHDPLTVYYALHPEICISEEVPVYLERQSPVIRGMTANLDLWFNSDKAAAKRVKCAKKVDAKKFIEIFFNYLYQR